MLLAERNPLLEYAQGQLPIGLAHDLVPIFRRFNPDQRRPILRSVPYAPYARRPLNPRVYRTRGGAPDGGEVGKRKIGSERNVFLVSELVVNFLPDFSILDLDGDTNDDDHILGQIRFDRDAPGGHSACRRHRAPVSWYLGRVLSIRGGLGGSWRMCGVGLYWR